jgi:F-type H+-transporting ATPase subunit b
VLIDWFTVAAQAVNFLVLVWLLKRFLYKPILDALDARERRIAEALNNADAQKAEAEKERYMFQRKNEAFDQQRAELFQKALDEARSERDRIISTARKDSQEIRARRARAMKHEYQDLNQTVARLVSAEVLAITRKVLADLASTALEAHMVEVFIKHLRELSDREKAQLASAVAGPALPTPGSTSDEKVAGVAVRTAFELSLPQRAVIESAIEESIGTMPLVRFLTVPDLISGIELIGGGYKLAWSAGDYLASLEKEIAAGISAHLEAEPWSEPEGKILSESGREDKAKAQA